MAKKEKNRQIKLIIAIVLLLIAVVFIYAQYRRARPTLSEPKRRDQPFQPPTFEQREMIREKMAEYLELSPEQKEEIKEIHGLGDMHKAFEFLSPEQLEKGRTVFQRMIRAGVSEHIKVLPPDQQKKFVEKLEQRMKNPPPFPRDRGGNDK